VAQGCHAWDEARAGGGHKEDRGHAEHDGRYREPSLADEVAEDAPTAPADTLSLAPRKAKTMPPTPHRVPTMQDTVPSGDLAASLRALSFRRPCSLFCASLFGSFGSPHDVFTRKRVVNVRYGTYRVQDGQKDAASVPPLRASRLAATERAFKVVCGRCLRVLGNGQSALITFHGCWLLYRGEIGGRIADGTRYRGVDERGHGPRLVVG
jgi:hypothetical protein